MTGYLAAQVKLTYGNNKVVTATSPTLAVETLAYDPLMGWVNFWDGFPAYMTLLAGEQVTYVDSNGVEKTAAIVTNGWTNLLSIKPSGLAGTGFLIKVKLLPYNGVRYWGGEGFKNLYKLPESVAFCTRFVSSDSPECPNRVGNWVGSLGSPNPDFVPIVGETFPDALARGSLLPFVIPSYLTDCSSMFENCGSLWDCYAIVTAGKPTNLKRMFKGCANLASHTQYTYPRMAGMDVSRVTDFTETFMYVYEWQPDIGIWDVGEARYMEGMFAFAFDNGSFKMNPDLSKWCVRYILSEPANFAAYHSGLTLKPVWGTCPVRKTTTFNLAPGLVQQGPYVPNDAYTFVTQGYNRDPLYNSAGTLTPISIVTSQGTTVNIKYLTVIDYTKTATGQVYSNSEIKADGNLGNSFELVLNGVTYVYKLMESMLQYGFWYSINPNSYLDPNVLTAPVPDFRQARTFDIKTYT